MARYINGLYSLYFRRNEMSLASSWRRTCAASLLLASLALAQAAYAADPQASQSTQSGESPLIRPIPHRFVPVTIAERLQSLNTTDGEVLIIEESAAAVDPAEVVLSVDRAFAREPVLLESGLTEAAADEATDAAGRVTAELLNEPVVDPLDVALYAVPPEPLDNVFLDARKAYVRGDLARLEKLAPILSTHLLKDYIELWTLTLRLKKEPDSPEATFALERFIELHPEDYIGERAALEYLQFAAERMNAERFDFFFKRLAWNKTDPEIAAWHAIYTLGTPDTKPSLGALNDAKSLYRDASAPHSKAYRSLGDAIVARDRSWAWPRVVILLQHGRWNEVKYALRDVPRPELPASLSRLHEIIDRPNTWMRRQKDLSKLPARLAVFAALRMSHSSPERAARIAEKCLDKKADAFWRSLVWMRIGYEATVNLDDRAFAWYRKAGRAFTQRPQLVVNAEQLQAWQARAAMRAGNWYSLNKIIDAMPASLRNEETWIYWRARALSARGLSGEAAKEFERIANRLTFYGRLAADAIRRPYPVGKPPLEPPRSDEINAWGSNPSIARARAFYRMHLYVEGHREWNWAMRGLKERDYIVLAAYAKENLLIHRMINTSQRSGEKTVDIAQRYPMPHFSLFSHVCSTQKIPLAWVYGLIRQESRFIPTVSSSVGAQGLMQVMPATAKWLAKKLGITAYDREHLTSLEMNLVLGTAYLNILYSDLNSSYVLATAAYNAGPARARSWRAALEKPMESAIFIETIPFFETRTYVKNVLANTLTYSLLDGDPIKNFTQFISTVQPSSATNPNIP